MIELTLATANQNEARLASDRIEHTSGLTVAVTALDPASDPDAIETADCVVAIVADETRDVPAVYETFRQPYPAQPLVMVTATSERAFIESPLDDKHGSYVHLSADGIPFGLLLVRCKRLIEAETAGR